MATIPEGVRDFLADETKAFMSLATIMPDGKPQVTLVWFNYDGKYIWINSVRGRVKDRNMRARPYIACMIVDPNDPYHYVQIRGEVIGITEEGAEDHIRDLSLKYRGHRDFNLRGETRVIYKIRPDHVQVR